MKDRGFTLIELMVVLAIMGGIVALSMPYITNRNSQTKAVLRELTVLSRELHTKAKLHGAIYRLVIDMQEDLGGKRNTQTYWVEKSNGKSVLKPDEEEVAFKEAQEASADKTGEKKKDPRGFEMDKTIIKKPRELPTGMTFEKVELSRLKEAVTHGKAFIHYMPQGLVDEAAIHIKGERTAAWTIAIHPLTGKAEVIPKPLQLKEIKSQ